MFKINVTKVGPGIGSHVQGSCKVELASEDGTEVVSVLDARLLRDQDGALWVDLPTVEFSKNLRERILDAVYHAYDVYQVGRLWVEYHGR